MSETLYYDREVLPDQPPGELYSVFPLLEAEYTYVSRLYQSVRSDIERHRRDPTIACEYARQACILAATLKRPAESCVWIDDGLESLGTNIGHKTDAARLRLLRSGLVVLAPFLEKDSRIFVQDFMERYHEELNQVLQRRKISQRFLGRKATSSYAEEYLAPYLR